MKRTARALLLFAIWLGTLAGIGWFAQRQLEIGSDLRLFLPSPTTPDERLLLQEIGEGPASRLLVVALDGAPPERLADLSRALADALRGSDEFRSVANGELALEAIPDSLLAYRFLLAPTLDTKRFDREYLRSELVARARDLASAAGAFLEPLLPRDPTLEAIKVLQRWQPTHEPRREFDVWFDRAGRRALMIVETRASAFDPKGQRAAQTQIERALTSVGGTDVRMIVSGTGRFSVMMEARTRGEAQALGATATIGMVVLLLIAYRRPGSILLSALPLVSAGLAGLAAVSALFGTVHGITLAFGFTLLGVAQDYPLHLLSHRRENQTPTQTARALWPTLSTGVASTCIAYLTFLFSGVIGLAQLATFTVAGLAVAALTTRFALPALMAEGGRDCGDSAFLDRLWNLTSALPRMRVAAIVVGLLCTVVVWLAPRPLWENDLAKLTPVPAEALAQEQELRAQLGTPDVRFLLVVRAAETEQALQRLEALTADLERLVERGAITGYDHVARYVPSAATQLRRRARLPAGPVLRRTLEEAQSQTAFRPGVFEPFLRDVEQARSLPAATIDDMQGSPLAASLEMLLSQRRDGVVALVTFSGVKDAAALEELAAAAGADTRLLDTKGASETLVARQREKILWSLAVAALLLAAVVTFALRKAGRVVRVLAPMALTTSVVLAILQGLGISLTLFHLIALILAAGLGLDYALFFEHAAADRAEQRRALHAIGVCSLSTLMVFALLAASQIPVLHAIGLTVSLGVVCNFVFSLLLTRPRAATVATPPLRELTPQRGAMALLERLIDWNEHSITVETDTHRSIANPLRAQGKLRAVHLCEYGAQATAVHGALRARAAHERAAPGMLVSLHDVMLARDYVHDLPGSLRVEAHCLRVSAASLQYSFRITHRGELLAEGRAAVMLGRP